MLNRLLGISICIAISSSAMAQSEEWLTFATSTNNTDWKMQASDIMNNSDYRPEIWIIRDHSKDKTVVHRETKTRIKFDCRAKKYYSLYNVQYRANGTVLDSWEGSSYKSHYAPPDSMIEAAMLYACPSDKTEK